MFLGTFFTLLINKMTRIVVLFSIILQSVYLTNQASFLQLDYINNINKEATTWKAGVNFDPNTPSETLLRLLGSKGVGSAEKTNGPYKTSDPVYVSHRKIPRHFDARKQWRNCKTIDAVRDQGNCGSCWAFGTTGAFADRLCIASEGKFNQLISAEEVSFCCRQCGFGCRGGHPIKAWDYFKTHGVVTGGNFNTSDGCQPYRVKSCLHHQEGEDSCSNQRQETNHRCSKICYGDEAVDYDSDHRKTRDAYYLTYRTIQKDVMAYGPIEASFMVYDDFFNYKSGVYVKSKEAKKMGGHAVKLIGWGVEYGVEYWLMVNSWGPTWGDNGLFKIRRGTNECGVDNSTTGGVPIYD